MQTLLRIPSDIPTSLIKERAMNALLLEATPYTYTLRSEQPLTEAQVTWLRAQLEFIPSEKGWPFDDVPNLMTFQKDSK